MKQLEVQKLSAFLKILVTLAFILNLLVLPLVPGLVAMRGGMLTGCTVLSRELALSAPAVFLLACWRALGRFWQMGSCDVVLTVFLWFCGICTAVILWQAKRVLDMILQEKTFSLDNARSLLRAAVCCFLIAAAALLRLCWGFWYYRSVAPLLTYNALFVPLFFMGGLLCLVMSALFRQAAELKAENDLTI